MSSTVQTFGPFTEAQGEVEAPLLSAAQRRWHEITVTILDDTGNEGVAATGTLSAKVRKVGADQTEDFTQALDLAANDRAWLPTLSSAQIFYFTVVGLNAGYQYLITVNSWEA